MNDVANAIDTMATWANSDEIAEAKASYTDDKIQYINEISETDNNAVLKDSNNKLKAQQDDGHEFRNGCLKDSGIGCPSDNGSLADYYVKILYPNDTAKQAA